ncbi:MAG: pyridoxal-phosphate dependent enzyme [Proteobacteria bacterium]|nr:pyridoxal-phosphate dependent enzyme [Pseudomonadota bacterium]
MLPSLSGFYSFVCASKCLSFTKAAEELSVTQGAISQQIRNLEDELGFKLFIRKSRTLELTKEGTRLAETLQYSFRSIESTIEEIANIETLKTKGKNNFSSYVLDRNKEWVEEAIETIEADFSRCADTNLIKINLRAFPGIDLYFKDESTHPTGSFKHRLARSLFMYALCHGWIAKGTTIIDASMGTTAAAEAYFASLLGLPYIGVLPSSISQRKIDKIQFYGGKCHLVEDNCQIQIVAQQLAEKHHGLYINQFAFSERAAGMTAGTNIVESIFHQMRRETHKEPKWIVVGAGTGGTSALIGRYIRFHKKKTQLCVVDPENSVFFEYYQTGNVNVVSQIQSRVEGIGANNVEPSFVPGVIDRMMRVPDAATFASLHYLEKLTGRKCGGSTGANFYGAMQLIREMADKGEEGSVVSLIADSGESYLDTYYNHEWLAANNYPISKYTQQIDQFCSAGKWQDIYPTEQQ